MEIITFYNRLRSQIGEFSLLSAIVMGLQLLAGGCAQPEGSVGSGVGGGPEGVQAQIVCQALIDTSFRAPNVGTGGSAYLYVGVSNGISSEGVIRYNRPNIPANARIDSVRVQAAYQGGIGSGVVPAVEAHLVYHPWIESNPPERGDLTGGTALSARLASGGDSGLYHFAIDTAEIHAWFRSVDRIREDPNWRDSTRLDTSLTVVLRAPAANDKLVRFRSRSASADSLRPYLMIFATFPDSAGFDTVKVGAYGDLFLPEDQSSLPSGRIIIGGGAVIRSALDFDLGAIWNRQTTHYVVVNRAVMTLTRDRSMFPWAPWTRSIWPYQMTSMRWKTEIDSAEYSGFVLIPTAIDSASDTLQILFSGPAITWARRDSTNYGALLESAGEGLDIERIGFYDSSDPNPARRPRLTVYYTELPR